MGYSFLSHLFFDLPLLGSVSVFFLKLSEEFWPMVATCRRSEGRRKGFPLFLRGSFLRLQLLFLVPWVQLVKGIWVTALAPQCLWHLGCGNTLSSHLCSFLRAVRASWNASSCIAWVLCFSLCFPDNHVD